MSDLLLDTHVVLWLLEDSPRLGPSARARIQDAHRVYMSAGSAWEIALKNALGKLSVPGGFDDAVASAGIVDLPISRRHGLAVAEADLPHRDPFDALLVTQARAEGLTFLTADGKILDSWADAVDARR